MAANRQRIWTSMALLAALAALPACEFRAAQDGERGNLRFHYTPADGSTDFERPLAVGSSLTMNVEPLGGRELSEIVSAQANPTNVLAASRSSESYDAIALTGLAEGSATLRVDARGGGSTYSDTTPIDVDTVDRVALAHRCTDQPDAAYVAGDAVSLQLERYNSANQRLAGQARSRLEAIDSCQVDIYADTERGQRDDLQERAVCDEAGLHLPNVNVPGPVEIFVDEAIGLTNGGHPDMGVHFVDREVIDFDLPEGDLYVDRTDEIEMLPFRSPPGTSQYWPVCSPIKLWVEILTPQTCSGPNDELDFAVERDEENMIALRGHYEGTCEFAVEFHDYPEFGEWIFDVGVY